MLYMEPACHTTTKRKENYIDLLLTCLVVWTNNSNYPHNIYILLKFKIFQMFYNLICFSPSFFLLLFLDFPKIYRKITPLYWSISTKCIEKWKRKMKKKMEWWEYISAGETNITMDIFWTSRRHFVQYGMPERRHWKHCYLSSHCCFLELRDNKQ